MSEHAGLKEQMMRFKRNGTRRASGKERESGSGMVMAVFVLFLVTSLGVALLFLSHTEVQLSQADGRNKVAYYYAEAALEKSRALVHYENLNDGGDIDEFDEELAAVTGPNAALDFDVNNLTATFDADGNLTALTGFGDDDYSFPLTGIGSGWHAAFLTNDPFDGINNLHDSNGKVMITGVGAGPDRSLEIVQAIVQKVDLYPMPPSTITILGEPGCDPDCAYFWGGNSTPKQYAGDDTGSHCPGGTPGLYVPVIGVIGSDSLATAQIGVIKPNSYFTGPLSGTDTVTDLTTDPSLDPTWTDCDLLVDLAQEILGAADLVGDSSTPNDDIGTVADPKISFINGDYVVGPQHHGAGILLVTGQLDYNGNADWQGIILVLGKGDFLRSGAGNGDIIGGVVVADIAGPDRVLFTDDDCAGEDGIKPSADDGIAQSTYHNDGGGNGLTAYCSAYLKEWQAKKPLKITSFLQR